MSCLFPTVIPLTDFIEIRTSERHWQLQYCRLRIENLKKIDRSISIDLSKIFVITSY
jgi:hypothetical protein